MSDIEDNDNDEFLEEEGSRSDIGSMVSSSKKSSVYERDPTEILGKKKAIDLESNFSTEERLFDDRYNIAPKKGAVDYNSFFKKTTDDKPMDIEQIEKLDENIVKNCESFLPTIIDEENADRNDTFYKSYTYYLISIGTSKYAIKIPSYMFIAMQTSVDYSCDHTKWDVKLGIFDTSIPDIGKTVKYLNEQRPDLIRKSFNKFYSLFWRKIEENSRYCASLFVRNDENNQLEEDEDMMSNYSRSQKKKVRYNNKIRPEDLDESVSFNDDLERLLEGLDEKTNNEKTKDKKNNSSSIEIADDQNECSIDINNATEIDNFEDLVNFNKGRERKGDENDDDEFFDPDFDDDMITEVFKASGNYLDDDGVSDKKPQSKYTSTDDTRSDSPPKGIKYKPRKNPMMKKNK